MREQTSPTKTAFMLDMYYECNMPAGAANEKAYERLQSTREQREVCLIEPKICQGKVTTVRSASIGQALRTQSFGEVEYALVTNDREASPKLVAIFHDDLALPLATFERREDDRCSFVQIGQEMHDDDYVLLY